jgi:hypothetical protein
MKRNILFIAIAIGIVTIISGIILHSCKKEEPNPSFVEKRGEKEIVKPFDYEQYIDDLSKETGINIRKLSKDEVAVNLYHAVNQFAQELDYKNFTDKDSVRFMLIYEEMVVAAQNADLDYFDMLYKELLLLLYGGNIPVYINQEYMHEFAMQNLANLQQIENSYPQLGKISEIQKEEVLSAVFYLISAENGAKSFSVNDCINEYNWARGKAALKFTASMGLCVLSSSGGPWVSVACVVWAALNLADDLHAAEVALERCN